MIRKITNGEYLKRFDNMTAVERREYLSRVGDWLTMSGQCLTKKGEVTEARMQNVLQISALWNDQECQVFEEGARLLSALTGIGDTWLPEMLYVKSAKRAIKQMFEVLWSVDEGDMEEGRGKKEDNSAVSHQPSPESPFQENAGNGAVAGEHQPSSITPARPKHIDQYVHLLPKKTQEHAALVQGLYREMDEARRKLDLLANDATASAADREAWAKKATKCDNTLRKIFDELDAEWAKLVKQGRVVVDDLGNARVMDDVRGKMEDDSAISHQPSAITSEQKARRRDLRKWLIDTRRGNGATREERVKQWYVNFDEYLALEGDAAFEDEKIKEAIKHYGIDTGKLGKKEN